MLKTPLNVPQQLAQFQSHGILVQDEAAALSILERVSYYRLSGYALEFRTSTHSDRYTPGTTSQLPATVYGLPVLFPYNK